jgi:hypothetical protein
MHHGPHPVATVTGDRWFHWTPEFDAKMLLELRSTSSLQLLSVKCGNSLPLTPKRTPVFPMKQQLESGSATQFGEWRWIKPRSPVTRFLTKSESRI